MHKILVLHGFTQNDRVAQSVFGHICNLTRGISGSDNVDFVFACGPNEVPEDVARATFERFGMPYNGWDATLAYLSDLERVLVNHTPQSILRQEHGCDFQTKPLQKEGPFHGILGFSQGAILATALAARQQYLASQGVRTSNKAPLTDIKFCVLVAGWKPHAAIMQPWFADGLINTPSLHAIGDREPPQLLSRMEELVSAYRDARVTRHSAGHVVPKEDAAVNDMVRFIVRHCP